MSSVLLTFPGRVPKDQQGYRDTRYDFGDGRTQAEEQKRRQQLDALRQGRE